VSYARRYICSQFYDRLVERRQEIVVEQAVQSTAVVASLFPKNVRDRLMEAQKEAMDQKTQTGKEQKRDL
jgi:hypothetical protein